MSWQGWRPEEQQEAAKQIKKGEKVQLPKKKITETTKSPNQEPKVVSVLDTEEQLPGQNEYGRIYSNARTSKCV